MSDAFVLHGTGPPPVAPSCPVAALVALGDVRAWPGLAKGRRAAPAHVAFQRSLGKARRTSARARPIHWGALISDQITGRQVPWHMGGAAAAGGDAGEADVADPLHGAFLALLRLGCGYYYDFPAREMQTIRKPRLDPLLQLGLAVIPGQPHAARTSSCATSPPARYDSYIRSFATAAKSWGHPFFLRFDAEMNVDWFPWARASTATGPASSSPPGATSTTSSRGGRHQRHLGLVPQHRVHGLLSRSPPLPRRRLRRLDLPGRLQLGHEPRKPNAGRPSPSSSAPATTRSPARSRPPSRWSSARRPRPSTAARRRRGSRTC